MNNHDLAPGTITTYDSPRRRLRRRRGRLLIAAAALGIVAFTAAALTWGSL